MSDLGYLITTSFVTFAAVFMLTRYGVVFLRGWFHKNEDYYRRVLNQELLLNVSPRVAVISSVSVVLTISLLFGIYMHWLFFGVGSILGLALPVVVVRHLAQKRKRKLELQLVDGITSLASGVRAGLTLIQSMELLVANQKGPIQQEFAQLLREYQMGMDLNQAMANTSNRIGSGNYRLLFTAVEMHRLRGGNTGESLDRIAESIREIQRLEGKLDAITAQGRAQAWMMAIAPVFIVGIYWMIDPEGADSMLTEPMGKMIMLGAALMILFGYVWIRKIMAVDI